jgi:outer membrane protein assembly factor BamB
MRETCHFLASLFVFLCFALRSPGENWTQFRGPGGLAISGEQSLPQQWSAGKNVAWKAKLPGYGWSAPIVWGDKVFLTTAVSEKQQKPSAGFGPGGFAGPGGPGGPGGFPPGGRGGRPGGFGGFPQPGQVLSSFLQDRLKITDEQKKELGRVQKRVDEKLASILTDQQKKQLKEPGRGPGRGGPGGFLAFPQPGQVLSAALRDRLKITGEQKDQLDRLQKDVDVQLGTILNEAQKKQLKEMREAFTRGPSGFMRGQRPPETVYRWEVYCLSAADGKVIWRQTAAERKPSTPISQWNTYATETPVTDGERVYAYFGMTGVFCYDLDGILLWQTTLGAYPMAFGHGSGSSPVLDGGKLFIQCDNEQKSFLVALDAKSGKELWRTPRTERTGWSTPFVWKNKLRTEIVCLGSPRVRSYDPQTGKQLWELVGMTGQCKASPVANEAMLYVGTGGGFGFGGPPGEEGPSGGGKPLFAIKAGASGDISLKEGQDSNTGVAWRMPQAGPSTASPLLFEGLLYILEERGGFLSCYDAKTGEKVYKERLPGARGFTSSPWGYEGKVLCLDDSGTTFVVKAGSDFKLLDKNALQEMCWSSPAVAAGSLFVRTVDHLFCIKKPAKSE